MGVCHEADCDKMVTKMVRSVLELGSNLGGDISAVAIIKQNTADGTKYQYGGFGFLLQQIQEQAPIVLSRQDIINGWIVKAEPQIVG